MLFSGGATAMSLTDQVAIVTGGGRAIGKAIALRLARDGASVVVAALDQAELETTAAEIQVTGRQALAVVADVTNEQAVSALAEKTLQTFGYIAVLVNNAAVIGPTALAVHTSRADWDDVLAVNLTGAFLCSKAVLPAMMARRSGRIINIASAAGKTAHAPPSPHAA